MPQLRHMGKGITMRQGYMLVSNQVISDLLKANNKTMGWFSNDSHSDEVCSWIHTALQLPNNSKVIGVSPHYTFVTNETSIKVECPDFKETPEGGTLVQVDAMYKLNCKFDDPNWFTYVVFDRWVGGVTEEYEGKMNKLAGLANKDWVEQKQEDDPNILKAREILEEAREKRVKFREFL